MEELKQQLTAVEAQIDAEKQKGAEGNKDLLAMLEQQQADILAQMDQAAQTQQHEERVQQASTDFFSQIDTLDLGEGITLRQVIGDENFYQLAAIGIKGVFQAQAEQFSSQITDLQTKLTNSNNQLTTANASLDDSNRQLQQAALDKQDAEAKRDNAVAALDDANKQIAAFQEQIKQGAQAAPINTEAEKQKQASLAEQFKRERTVYDVTPDNEINPKSYTAKKALTGEEITYNWTQKNAYIVIDASEVDQFRSDNAFYITPKTTEEVDMDNTGIPDGVPAGVDSGIGVPTFPTQDATALSEQTVVGATDGTVANDTSVSRGEFAELQAIVYASQQRIAALEAVVA